MDIYERAMLLRLMVDIAEQTLCAMFIFSFFLFASHRSCALAWLFARNRIGRSNGTSWRGGIMNRSRATLR